MDEFLVYPSLLLVKIYGWKFWVWLLSKIIDKNVSNFYVKIYTII